LAGFSGFVWEEGGKMVGNLTLSRWEEGYLISNVAVHPDFRRRSIARRLMEAAIRWAEEKGAPWLVLEVRRQNTAAKNLYQSLGFVTVDVTSEMRAASNLALPKDLDAEDEVGELSLRRDWPRLWQLHQSSLTPPGLRILGKEPDDFRPSLASLLSNGLGRFFAGREMRHWGVEKEGELVALLTLDASRMGFSNKMEILVHPRWLGEVEKGLMARAAGFLARFPRGPVQAKIRRSSPETVSLFQKWGLREAQTLERMGLGLKNQKGE
ncbi:MAG: GNAT family N-acetyltransferase, partial [Chloroflexi bacterium]|nr:GNAT family N-acetyltransferase [Chloroflexota bacterium]